MAAQPENDVTPAQAGLLFILGKQDGILMGEAGTALDLGPAGISGLVDRTAAAKLVERRADREDGRAWRIWLTPKGRTALAQAKAGAAEVNAALTEGFTGAEIDIVARWLTSVHDKFPRDPEESEEQTHDRACPHREQRWNSHSHAGAPRQEER